LNVVRSTLLRNQLRVVTLDRLISVVQLDCVVLGRLDVVVGVGLDRGEVLNLLLVLVGVVHVAGLEGRGVDV